MKLKKITMRDSVPVAPRVTSEKTLFAHDPRRMGVDLDLELIDDLVVVRADGADPCGIPLTNIRAMWPEEDPAVVPSVSVDGAPGDVEGSSTYTAEPAHPAGPEAPAHQKPKKSKRGRKGR